jgi:ureidoacrylate peracid hydrolase
MRHPSGIPDRIVEKVVARRGRLHAFDTIDPKTTALVVIDLDEATVVDDDTWQRIIRLLH